MAQKKELLLKGWTNSVKNLVTLCKLSEKQDEERTFFSCLWVIPSVQA